MGKTDPNLLHIEKWPPNVLSIEKSPLPRDWKETRNKHSEQYGKISGYNNYNLNFVKTQHTSQNVSGQNTFACKRALDERLTKFKSICFLSHNIVILSLVSGQTHGLLVDNI